MLPNVTLSIWDLGLFVTKNFSPLPLVQQTSDLGIIINSGLQNHAAAVVSKARQMLIYTFTQK